MTDTTAAHIAKEDMIPDADRRRALWGSAIGSTIEWYDYFLYGTMSAIVFGNLFFPSSDPVVSQLLALTSFALAFVIRPFGGVIFAHIGDRIGRKKTLVFTLGLMGFSTVAMGLLPTYETIGIMAPILLTLLRLLQGVALGGEWGGGVLLAVEYSPRKKRGFFGAVPQTGAVIGLALGNLITAFLSSIFSDEAFLAWGWRIPFILSIVLVFVGMYIRNRIDETPSFRRVLEQNKAKRVPVVETFRTHSKEVFIAIGTKAVETSTFFLYATFTIQYLVGLGYSRVSVLNIVLLAAVLAFPMMLYFGKLSDKIGRKKVFVGGTIAIMVWILPYFWLLNQGSIWLIALALLVGMSIIWATYGAMIGTVLAEAFPADIRYTGMSLGYQLGAALVGGPMPLIATALMVAYSGSYIPVALFIMGCAAISLVAMAFTKDRTGVDLDAH
ncbi:MFS transporter [Ketogulonicigenium vulgare]|uniref:General substrate transporter n=1 Tax=Ketogulonicigenium vulgare (strain WSH-001) TaxID=759362 RepID=F9Y516_KETVW|nr:MFS transporter [Ketogulonicigenium vulgare]AEM40648.1 General substrate transporter [Ketogulonicigenium vulgare WSH-001]ALJ80821.1 MFS transporter [Ketogulonicigenium vulgare]ANW33600.1 MFS transporter [Ketogulonicigenium vulgare]AOZ54362.1 shikimate transporter [Ketogulonicigenium vulgare]